MDLRRRGKRTYWHLSGAQRRPTIYDIVTSRLLYYPALGFSVRTEATEHYQQFQLGSGFSASDWEGFSDPRRTTYASYVELQHVQESVARHFVEQELGAADHDAWRAVLQRWLGSLRYYFHAAMMCAAYIGSMAPSGRITVASAFQSADESRRVHQLAQRMGFLRLQHQGFGANARQIFEQDPVWQPLRRLLEQLLCCYNWGESFAALNFAVKPLVETIALGALAERAHASGDHGLSQLLNCLAQDSTWHESWAVELARTAVGQRTQNLTFLAECTDRWARGAVEAIDPLAAELADSSEIAMTKQALLERAQHSRLRLWQQLEGACHEH